MNKISVCANVIINLHERGYIHDFVVAGNGIWWIQESCYLPVEDFTIMECHEINDRCNDREESFIAGLVATRYNVKGILIDHRRRNTVLYRLFKEFGRIRAVPLTS